MAVLPLARTQLLKDPQIGGLAPPSFRGLCVQVRRQLSLRPPFLARLKVTPCGKTKSLLEFAPKASSHA